MTQTPQTTGTVAVSLGTAPALTPDQFAAWQEGVATLRRATRGAGVARISGWTLAVFAAITALGGMSDPVSLGTAIGMAVIAWSEFRGARQVRSLNPAGARRLVINQIAILALVGAYAGLSIARAATSGPAAGLEPTGEAQVDRILADVDNMTRMIMIAVYAIVLVTVVPLQGLMAWYHARKRAMLRRWLERTPAWVVQMAGAAEGGASRKAAHAATRATSRAA